MPTPPAERPAIPPGRSSWPNPRPSERLVWLARLGWLAGVLLLAVCQNVSPAAASQAGVSRPTPVPYLSFGSPPSQPSPVAAQILRLGPLTVPTPGDIGRYQRFEIAFAVLGSRATNPYFPYDPSRPPGVRGGSGINVEALFLPPGKQDWSLARRVPCFYYQPVRQVGQGAAADLLPEGEAGWRCRFAPDMLGAWSYEVVARERAGVTVSERGAFDCVEGENKGFVQVSTTDPRFFAFADGTPFVTPLINMEQGNPLNSLSGARQRIRALGENGVRFVRWFPVGSGSNYRIVPYGHDIRSSWGFGTARAIVDEVDSASGKLFSFRPDFHTAQSLPVEPGARYQLSLRALVTDQKLLHVLVLADDELQARLLLCAERTRCDRPDAGWQEASLEFVAPPGSRRLTIVLRDGLAADENALGKIRISWVRLQRDESGPGRGRWGPQLLTRPDPNTYAYVDQVAAARLDDVLQLSEQYGVYHKLTLFDKADPILNRLMPDGTPAERPDDEGKLFYGAPDSVARWYEQAYVRYFLARWSYSTALHSLELANENDLAPESYEAAFALARYVKALPPRPLLMSNSFWGWFPAEFWAAPERAGLMDYADKHWYADRQGAGVGEDLISREVDDSAANVRECWKRFEEYARRQELRLPIVRGETGVAQRGTEPQDPALSQDRAGIYYHKQLWAHVGVLGYQCGGEWYTEALGSQNLWGTYAAYERFIRGEPLANGRYEPIGTDLAGPASVGLSEAAGQLRAWGMRDGQTGRVLLWVDNAAQTWRAVVTGATIPAAGGTLTVTGLAPGAYEAEWWDTWTGAVISRTSHTVTASRELRLEINGLAGDQAVKLARQGSSDLSRSLGPLAG